MNVTSHNIDQCQAFAVSRFLNITICCFSLSFMVVNEVSLGFGQKKQFKEVTWCSGKLWWPFLTILGHFKMNQLIMKKISRLILTENNCSWQPQFKLSKTQTGESKTQNQEDMHVACNAYVVCFLLILCGGCWCGYRLTAEHGETFEWRFTVKKKEKERKKKKMALHIVFALIQHIIWWLQSDPLSGATFVLCFVEMCAGYHNCRLVLRVRRIHLTVYLD